MENESLSLGDVFEPFYDRKEEFDALLERLAKEEDPGDGSHPALISLEGLNAEDQRIVDAYCRSEQRRIENMGSVQDSSYTGKGPVPYAPIPLAAIQLTMMKNGLKAEKREVNCYILLQKILNQYCIRNYKEQIFCFFERQGYVKLSDKQIKSLLFAVLEPEIEATGSPQVLRHVQELLVSYHRIKVERTTDDIHHIYFKNGCLDAIF